jgi:hypothetical protein
MTTTLTAPAVEEDDATPEFVSPVEAGVLFRLPPMSAAVAAVVDAHRQSGRKRKPVKPVREAPWGSSRWPRRDWRLRGGVSPAAPNNIDRERLGRAHAEHEAACGLVVLRAIRIESPVWPRKPLRVRQRKPPVLSTVRERADDPGWYYQDRVPPDGRPVAAAFRLDEHRHDPRGCSPCALRNRTEDGRPPELWRAALLPDCFRTLPPASPRPLRALNRPLANPYMEFVAAEERMRRVGGDSRHTGEEGRTSTLYQGAGVPDGRCVCHWAAGFDAERTHGFLCPGCHQWLVRHQGKTREDLVEAIVRARLAHDLHYPAREERGYGHEVVVDMNQASGGFEPPDLPPGETIRHASSIPYRTGAAGQDDDNGDNRESDFYESDDPSAPARVPLPNPLGTPDARVNTVAWATRWFGLRLPRKRMRVRVLDGTVKAFEVSWTTDDIDDVDLSDVRLPSKYGRDQQKETRTLLAGEEPERPRRREPLPAPRAPVSYENVQVRVVGNLRVFGRLRVIEHRVELDP